MKHPSNVADCPICRQNDPDDDGWPIDVIYEDDVRSPRSQRTPHGTVPHPTPPPPPHQPGVPAGGAWASL